MDDGGIYQSMRNSDWTFLDSEQDNWVSESQNRWGGQVEDGNHGITELYLPVVADGPATDLIDRYDDGSNPDSYENSAGLRLVDGQAYYRQSDNTWINVTSNLIADGIVTVGSFYDGRESQEVASIDIDISRLNGSPYFPSNGIIYYSTPESYTQVNAVRLVNGSQLGGPLTVATNNPLYTVGDYNTIDKQPASLVSDALTILSNGWDDANSWSNMYARQASNTIVNASYLTGNTETGSPGHNYNGGLENLPRFLEDWDGRDFKWRGSAVDLWYSRQNTGAWGSDYYRPPNRNWAFDTDLLDPDNMPPGTPMVNIVQRNNWSQKIYDLQRYANRRSF